MSDTAKVTDIVAREPDQLYLNRPDPLAVIPAKAGIAVFDKRSACSGLCNGDSRFRENDVVMGWS